MRIDIEPVNGRDGLAVRRSVKYHDGSVCRVDYLSFITGEWMQKEATGKLPKECFRDDELIELLELGPLQKFLGANWLGQTEKSEVDATVTEKKQIVIHRKKRDED